MRRLGSSRFAKQLFESQIPVANAILAVLEPQQQFLLVYDPHNAIRLDKFAILISLGIRCERYHEEFRLIGIPCDLVAVIIKRHDREFFFFKSLRSILDGICIFHIQNGIAIDHRDFLALVITDFAIRNAVGIHCHLSLRELFTQDVAIVSKQRIAFHKRDNDLAESLFRNHN